MGNRLLDLQQELRAIAPRPTAAPTIVQAKSRRTRALSAVNYQVPGIVPVVRQDKSMACWAAVTTILMSWRQQQSMSIATAMAQIGQQYLDLYNANTGLAADQKQAFANAAGLVFEPPMNFSIEGWEQLLRDYGPLWVTTASPSFAIHGRVMRGIAGDGTPDGTRVHLIDPAGGREYTETVSEFVRSFEREAAAGGDLRIQVVHFPAQSQSKSWGMAAPQSRAFEIPLDPGAGGRSIGESALQIGDIIVSTTSAGVSRLIRWATSSVVSHAMIYIGGGQVVEAIGDGVVLRSLMEALNDATVAVAFRHPSLSSTQALMVRDFAGQQLGRSYNYWGIVQQGGFQLDRATFCSGKTGADYDRCVNWVGRVNLGRGSDDSFFCSQLVLAAYQHAGVPLTSTPPHWNSPDDLAQLGISGRLGYVGHLKATESGSQSLSSTARYVASAHSTPTLARAQVAPAVVEAGVAAAGLGWTVFNGILQNQGDIKWQLQQMDGAKHPFDRRETYENRAPWQEQTIRVEQKVENYLSDQISAAFELRFRHNGNSVGYVSIQNIGTNDAALWGLEVGASIMVDPNAYNFNSTEPVAAVEVTFNYRFFRSIGSDKIFVTRIKLYGNGTWRENGRWTQ